MQRGGTPSRGRTAWWFATALAMALPLVMVCLFSVAWADGVEGVVTDEAGRPLAGARVRWQGRPEHVITDRDGRFRLPRDFSPERKLTAWMPGYFIGGSQSESRSVFLRLRPLPEKDHEGYAWVDPTPDANHAERCGNCHAVIHQEWAGSAHARSAVNRRFRNLYDGSDWHGQSDRGWNLLRDHPTGAGVCAACHAPTVPVDHPGFDDLRQTDGLHALGVHCDFCHKIAEARTDRLGLEHGRYAYDLLRPRTGQVFFGPLDDVDRDEDAFSPLYKQSRYCAACHEGIVFGVPVYTTYSEWLASPARQAGKQCQDCHMTPSGSLTNIAPGHGGIERDPLTLASHSMPGATPEMLRRAVRMQTRLQRTDNGMKLEVALTGGDVGHRIPTGFVDRRLVLTVTAMDGSGSALTPTSGPLLPADAGWGVNQPGLLFAKVLEDYDGQSPVPFWHPSRIREDTRLEPGKTRTATWTFPGPNVRAVQVKLTYYRFPPQVSRSKGWPDDAVVVYEKTLPGPGLSAQDSVDSADFGTYP